MKTTKINYEPWRITFAFDLASLMRKNKVTIPVLAKKMGITQDQVRARRAAPRIDYATKCDYEEAVTGVKTWSKARYEAITIAELQRKAAQDRKNESRLRRFRTEPRGVVA